VSQTPGDCELVSGMGSMRKMEAWEGRLVQFADLPFFWRFPQGRFGAAIGSSMGCLIAAIRDRRAT
jgi:hypothetical protein